MTELSKRKSKLVFETADEMREHGRYRPIVAEPHPFHMSVRLKGLKTSYDVSWAAIYQLAVKIQVENERREKRKART